VSCFEYVIDFMAREDAYPTMKTITGAVNACREVSELPRLHPVRELD
jgi:hypothetical protein